jgi:hypothetical protein
VKILHLTLLRTRFDEIAIGRKTHEFRKITPYWTRRLLDPRLAVVFDEVHFRNGYSWRMPFMRVEWKGLGIRGIEGEAHFAIKLGQVLEIRNWEGPKV